MRRQQNPPLAALQAGRTQCFDAWCRCRDGRAPPTLLRHNRHGLKFRGEDAVVSSWPGTEGRQRSGGLEMSIYFLLLQGSGINLPSQWGEQGRGEPPLQGVFGSAWSCRRMLCLAGGPLGGQVPLPPVPEGIQLRERGQVPHHQGSLRGKETAGAGRGWSLLQSTHPRGCPAPPVRVCQERSTAAPSSVSNAVTV